MTNKTTRITETILQNFLMLFSFFQALPVNNYFVDALISDIIEDLSAKYNCSSETASAMLYNGGYKIYATIDTDIQDTMESVYLKQKT